MSFIGKAIGKLTGASDQAKAAQQAATTQAASADAGIAEQRRQFDLAQAQQLRMYEEFQKQLAPFVNAGGGALTGQQNLLGLNGNDAQQAAISGIESSPQFAALKQQGEESILANASATGGLRGGNVQGTLAQFSPALLAQLIEQQYSRLGNLTALGQNSAVGVGTAGINTGNSIAQAGMQTGANVANLLQQQGSATAGGQLAMGSIGRQGFGDVLGFAGALTGMKKAGMF